MAEWEEVVGWQPRLSTDPGFLDCAPPLRAQLRGASVPVTGHGSGGSRAYARREGVRDPSVPREGD